MAFAKYGQKQNPKIASKSVFVYAQFCLTLHKPMDYIAHQTPLFMEISRQEYWSGLPLPPQGDLPYPRTEPTSLVSPAFSGRFFTISTT